MLLINNDMIIHDVAKRAAVGIPDEVVNHAKDLNVLIIQTIDLLVLMRQLEQDSHREKKMAHVLVSGRGWHRTAGL